MMRDLHRLVDVVQRNCHISDARHAREMTMCTYLLEMREFFRWEHDIPLGESPAKDELGRWLTAREALWGEVEAEDFAPLPLGAERLDPFEAVAVNRRLAPFGLVYGGGYGRFRKPHFFLAELLRREVRDGFEVLVSGCEYARDIAAIPAAFQGGAIYLRRDALRRWLWEKAELWQMRKAAGPLRAALTGHGFEDDPRDALDRMTDAETESVILHEVGEGLAERLLGPPWKEMVASLASRRAEILARAVRDNLADCLSTLPGLIERGAASSVHFYFANHEGMRRELFPSLGRAYKRVADEGRPAALAEAAAVGAEHWHQIALQLIALHRADPDDADRRLEALAADPASIAL
jgi:hypothetical protein